MKWFISLTFFIVIILTPSFIFSSTPSEALTYFSMGYYYLYDGELSMAKSQFKLSLEFEKEPPSLLYTILSEISNMQGEKAEAEEYALKALEINPSNEDSLQMIASLSFEGKNYEDALYYLEKLSKMKPNNLQVLYYLAEVYDAIKNDDKLIETYNRMIQINPDMLEVRLNLAYLLTKQGRYNLAMAEFIKVLEQDPDNERAIFYLTYIYLNEGKTDDALELFKKLDNKDLLDDEMLEDYAINLFVEDQDPRPVLKRIKDREKLRDTSRAIISFLEGKNQEAQELFEKVVQENSQDIPACVGLIRIAVQKGNIDMEKKWRFVLAGIYYNSSMFEKALEEASRVEEVDPYYLENRYLLGDIYNALGMIQKAISEYEFFAKHSDEKGDVYIKLGINYDEIKDNKNSIKNFLSAIELFPENDELFYYLGIEYRIIEDYENAISAFKKAIDLNGKQAIYFFYLGASYERLGEIDEAIEYLDKSIKLDDSSAVVLNYLGYMLADKGIRLEEAKQYIEKALSIDPENGAYLDSLGWVYFRLAEYQKAKEYIEKSIENIILTDEENYLIFEHLGDVYNKIGLINDAISAWKRALDMKYIESVRKKIEEAEGELNN